MLIAAFVIGMVIGSFLNVCIYRIPEKESIIFPYSYCPKCGTHLKPYELIPILSYILQKGKCRYCREGISLQYPLVEFLTGIIFMCIYSIYRTTWNFVFYIVVASILVFISFVDVQQKIIPNGSVLFLFLFTILYKIIMYILYSAPCMFINSILGLVVGGGTFLLIALISGGGMGGGDIKLMAALGFILGVKKTFLAMFLSFIIGAIVCIALLLDNKKNSNDFIAFGPFINIAFLIAVLLGDGIISCYLSLIG